MRRVFASLVLLAVIAASAEGQALALLPVGSPAPSFSLNDTEGREVSLSGFSSKKAVILLFWASWSGNSPKALKRFEEFHRRYAERGLQVIGINVESQDISPDEAKRIREFAAQAGVTFPVLLDRGLQTFHDYGVIALPSTMVISGGKVVYELPGLPLVGSEELFDYLLGLAGEPVKKERKGGYVPRYDAVADTNLARALMKKRQAEAAKALLRKAMEKDPLYVAPYLELARISAGEGKQQEAEETLRKALTLQPSDNAALAELGYSLARRGELRESLGTLRRASGDDTYAPAWYYLAYALAKSGDAAASREACQKALSLNPYDPALRVVLADISEEGGDLRGAAASLRKALELSLGGGFPGIPTGGGFHP